MGIFICFQNMRYRHAVSKQPYYRPIESQNFYILHIPHNRQNIVLNIINYGISYICCPKPIASGQ